MSFVHLHLHTQYSLLDGANKISALVPRVKAFGMPAAAITDHGNMFGAIEFYKTCTAAGVQPILGCEVYLAPRSRKEQKAVSKHDDFEAGGNFHMILLAMNLEGYRNLCKLVTLSYTEGFYFKPRIDKELLAELNGGLIGTSGCLSGEINRAFQAGNYDRGREIATDYLKIFGDRFYLEIQDNHLPQQVTCNEMLKQLGRDLGIPLLATNDCHYLTPEDAKAHEVLLCIQTGKTLSDPTRWKFDTDQLYVKGPDEVRAAFADVPDAVANTIAVARRCELELKTNFQFPMYRVDPGETLEARLDRDARRGLEQRLAAGAGAQRTPLVGAAAAPYWERLDSELAIIEKMGFAGYFLIVADFINWAKGEGIPVGPGRGSAAGSLVAYALRITDLDPLPYNLLFERFLNPGRRSMPDIDVDFCYERRDEVIRYVREKYGEDRVAGIITFGTLKGKAAIKDVGRVLEFSYGETDRIAKLYPAPVQGKDHPLEKALELEPRLKELRDREREKPLFDYAFKLEGLLRHASKHAAGIVISDRPLAENLPLFVDKDKAVLTQYSYGDVEWIGLIKFDFLGLKTLTLLANIVELIQQHRAKAVDLATLPLDDRKTYQLLCKGDTTGVFQMESGGMRKMVTQLRPSRFEDLIAALALFRPGPLDSGMDQDFIKRKYGKEKVNYDHPLLEEILKETYGTLVYQEQVMQIARVLAGYSMADADNLRRAMGKKKKEEMDKERDRFRQGAVGQGIKAELATTIFDQMEKFAAYGFNKCVVGKTIISDALTGERSTVEGLFARPRPFFVHALDAAGRLVPRAVERVLRNGRKPVFELRTAQGKRIVATANHPFRTLDGWKHLGDLRVGDRIAAPRQLHVPTDESWPEYQVVALAGLLSEGNTCHPSCLYFFGNDPALVDDFAHAAACFPHSVARVYQRADHRYEVCVSTGRDGRFVQGQVPWNARAVGGGVVVKSAAPVRSGMFQWASSLGILGRKAADKVVPPAVFRLRDADLEIFLGRLWAGDGFIANATNFVPFYATSSPDLARDVQALLLRLGIQSGVHVKAFKYRGRSVPGYTVHLLGEGSVETFLGRVAPHCVGRQHQVALLRRQVESTARGRTSKDTIPATVRAWIDEARRARGLTWRDLERRSGVSTKELYGCGSHKKRGFRRSTIAKLGEFLGCERLKATATAAVFWDCVVAIEPRGIEETFDLTVAVDHNFVADGLVVHNSHSAAYALISFQTAYLKAHYRHEFMAGLLSLEMGEIDKTYKNIAECRAHRIPILPPDINESGERFTVTANGIRFGLGAVKGVGSKAIDIILAARREGGPFTDLADFANRVRGQQINRRVLECLIKCGTFDSLGISRATLLTEPEGGGAAYVDRVLQWASTAAESAGQITLFALGSVPPPPAPSGVPEWSDKQRLAAEKETVGFYITGHPLDRFDRDLRRLTTGPIAELGARVTREREKVKVGGVVHTLKLKNNKKGDRYATFNLEDKSGTIEVIVWPEAYRKYEALIASDEPLCIGGMLEVSEERCQIIADDIGALAAVRQQAVRELRLRLDEAALTAERAAALARMLEEHPGNCTASIEVLADGYVASVRLPRYRVAASDRLVDAVEQLFGGRVAFLQ